MAERNEILERVKKLLTLADPSRGATPEEAATAAAKAQALLYEHNLSMADMTTHETPGEYENANTLLRSDRHNLSWHRRLVYAIAKTHFCSAIQYPGTLKMALIGKRGDIEFCLWLYEYLQAEIIRMADATYQAEGVLTKPLAWKRAFAMGAVGTISNRLYRKQQDMMRADTQTTALVHVSGKGLEQAVAKFFGRVRKSRAAGPRLHAEAFHLGQRAGYSLNLNRPIGSAAGSCARLNG